jgi:hypothetical protein
LFALRWHEDDKEMEHLRAENERLKDELHAVQLRNMDRASTTHVPTTTTKRLHVVKALARNSQQEARTQTAANARLTSCTSLSEQVWGEPPIAREQDGNDAAARAPKSRSESTRTDTLTPGTGFLQSRLEAHARGKAQATVSSASASPARSGNAQKLSSGALFYGRVVKHQMQDAATGAPCGRRFKDARTNTLTNTV